MSSTITTATDPSGARVRAYVTQVRAELGDLPGEEVDELTLGMEADLAELASESGIDLRTRLGSPQSYAAELRSAAGLPPRAAPQRTGLRAGLSAGWQSAAAAGERLLDAAPWLRELRSAWWVARGLVFAAGLSWLLGTFGGLLGILLGTGLSIWLGLCRRSSGGNRWRTADRAATLLGLLLLLPGTAYVLTRTSYFPSWSSSSYSQPYVDPAPEEGIVTNGERAANLYAYDAQGNRIDGVRLFDQNGAEISLSGSDAANVLPSIDSEEDPAAFERLVEQSATSFPASWANRNAWDGMGSWTPPVTIVPLPQAPGSATASSSPSSTEPSGGSATSPQSATSPSSSQSRSANESSTGSSSGSPSKTSSSSSSSTSETTRPRPSATSTSR